MISIVAGNKGEGKTKKLIEMANESLNNVNGNIVYIDNNNKHMFNLNHNIRFISTTDFPLQDYKEFYGFICGIISEDHDINEIYFDGLLELAHLGIDKLQELINKLKSISDKYNIQFIISISCELKTLPDYLKSFLVA